MKYAYENAPDSDENWRSPQQKSGSYATQAHTDDDSRQWWVSLSGSDREAGLGRQCASGCHGDAFDLFVQYEHGGDLRSALTELQVQEALADFAGLDLLDLPLPAQPAAGGSKFRLLSLDELEHEAPREPVIKGLVGRGDLGCIFGQPGAGKSLLGPYLAFRVAQGLPVFGMKTIAGSVIYVGAEDAHGMGRRLRALRKVYGESGSVHLATGLAGMMTDVQSPEMRDLLQCIARLKPALVVIDTLAVGFPIDENASREMGAVVQICRTINEQGSAGVRYRSADRRSKGPVLDECVALTGFHRKHAMRLLREKLPAKTGGPRIERRIYDEAVRTTLVVLWAASDRLCGKRLRPLIPILLEAMERYGHLDVAQEIKTKLTTMSAATIDRALRDVKARIGRDHLKRSLRTDNRMHPAGAL